MAVPTVDVLRVNHRIWSWNSCRALFDGQPSTGIVALDYDQSLETRTIYSNAQDGPPLGMSVGRYAIAVFPLRMLADSARALRRYLAAKAPAATAGPSPSSSWGATTFSFTLQLASIDAGDMVPTSLVFSSCRVLGEKLVAEEGIDELVVELRVGCLLILQDGLTLWNALPQTPTGFPAVDTITIANVQAPGKWTLQRAPKVYGWDIRKGYGLQGATVVPVGDELVEAEFLVEIWDPSDFVLFQAFRSAYLKKALVGVAGAPTAMALGIDHPELSDLGCTSVVVKEINPLVNDGYGVWSCTVKFLQYRPPQPTLARPNASIPDAAPPQPTAQDALEAEAQQQQAELQALGGL